MMIIHVTSGDILVIDVFHQQYDVQKWIVDTKSAIDHVEQFSDKLNSPVQILGNNHVARKSFTSCLLGRFIFVHIDHRWISIATLGSPWTSMDGR